MFPKSVLLVILALLDHFRGPSWLILAHSFFFHKAQETLFRRDPKMGARIPHQFVKLIVHVLVIFWARLGRFWKPAWTKSARKRNQIWDQFWETSTLSLRVRPWPKQKMNERSEKGKTAGNIFRKTTGGILRVHTT